MSYQRTRKIIFLIKSKSCLQCSAEYFRGAKYSSPPHGPGGLIFIQNNSDIGHASYHFEEKPFVDYKNIDLGVIFPGSSWEDDSISHSKRKYFENWEYEKSTRTFIGELTWKTNSKNFQKWKYKIIFDTKFQSIEGMVSFIKPGYASVRQSVASPQKPLRFSLRKCVSWPKSVTSPESFTWARKIEKICKFGKITLFWPNDAFFCQATHCWGLKMSGPCAEVTHWRSNVFK